MCSDNSRAMLSLHEGLQDRPKCRVELHVHLDGAIRLETLWDLLRSKSLPSPGDGSLAALREALSVSEPKDLACFLNSFQLICPALQGDLAAIERVSREFVEDRSRDCVAYCEARFAPHLLLPPGTEPVVPETGGTETGDTETGDTETGGTETGGTETEGTQEGRKQNGAGSMTADDVMEAVLRGVAEGEASCPGTKIRLLLCCMRGMPQLSWDVLRLCEQYRNRGVVGIDIAGSHAAEIPKGNYSEGWEVFQAAAAKGIHRTVHAGEDAPAASVLAALEDLKAERIGHGYRVLEDEAVYAICKEANLHFEVCPHSSYMTGSMKQLQLPSKRHPVIRFASDGCSYGISTDDPILTGTSLQDEYTLLYSWGFTEANISQANFNAALSSFLPPVEKQALLHQLRTAYGVVDYRPPSPAETTPSSSSSGGKATPVKPNITFNTWENRA